MTLICGLTFNIAIKVVLSGTEWRQQPWRVSSNTHGTATASFCNLGPYYSKHRKGTMATKLANTPYPAEFRKDKPLLSDPLSLLPCIPKLRYFIGPQSHLIFHFLRVGSNWLRQPLNRWPQDEEFMRVGDFLKDLNVVNDNAEQCIKDIYYLVCQHYIG